MFVCYITHIPIKPIRKSHTDNAHLYVSQVFLNLWTLTRTRGIPSRSRGLATGWASSISWPSHGQAPRDTIGLLHPMGTCGPSQTSRSADVHFHILFFNDCLFDLQMRNLGDLILTDVSYCLGAMGRRKASLPPTTYYLLLTPYYPLLTYQIEIILKQSIH